MPTILLLDVSLSMARNGLASTNSSQTCSSNNKENIETADVTKKALAVHTIYKFLDFLTTHAKLEYVCLMVYSSLWEVKVPFTRDYDLIRSAIDTLTLYDKTCLYDALTGLQDVVQSMWGSTMHTQIVVISDGFMELSPQSVSQLSTLNYPFPYDLNMICLSSADEFCCDVNLKQLQSLVGDMKGTLLYPEPHATFATIDSLVEKYITDTYKAYNGTLHCGCLNSHVQLFPPPSKVTREDDFSVEVCDFPEEIHIVGFLPLSDVKSPACISQHLVLPLSENKLEDGKVPSFCVMLHGALKIESHVAIAKLSDSWFGMLHSYADSKKKCNLVLSVFKPGVDSVPWLGDMSCLGPMPTPSDPTIQPASGLPVPVAGKKSYSNSSASWLRQATLQSDVQKLLRYGRKLPDKLNVFYKELNRLHKSAISIGFYELLIGLSEILERECRLLPSTAHPEAMMQLQHAADQLKNKELYTITYVIQPLNTHFSQ